MAVKGQWCELVFVHEELYKSAWCSDSLTNKICMWTVWCCACVREGEVAAVWDKLKDVLTCWVKWTESWHVLHLKEEKRNNCWLLHDWPQNCDTAEFVCPQTDALVKQRTAAQCQTPCVYWRFIIFWVIFSFLKSSSSFGVSTQITDTLIIHSQIQNCAVSCTKYHTQMSLHTTADQPSADGDFSFLRAKVFWFLLIL